MTTSQFNYEQPPKKLFSIDVDSIEAAKNSITFHSGSDEMLRVSQNGFYVRGVRIEQDAKEAQQVYESFRAWLTWAQLNKS
jgi:hypothetical protein